jgi:hypothetical protein
MGEMKNTYTILFGPFRRHRRREEYNIKMDFKETGWEVVNWKHLA